VLVRRGQDRKKSNTTGAARAAASRRDVICYPQPKHEEREREREREERRQQEGAVVYVRAIVRDHGKPPPSESGVESPH
jgi:hypothetical protein